ncbi:MAG: LemA family protein [Candidatus Scatovivens sp.]
MSGLVTILICIFIIFIVPLFISYNIFIHLRNKVKQSKSSIDVYLAKRFDLIPNLVETVKGYAKFEKDLFKEVIKLREVYNQTKGLNEAEKLNNDCNKILMLKEEYPELNSSENFLRLQKEIINVEGEIQAARRIYNSDVTIYNTKIEKFPTNIVANLFHFKKAKLFQIDEIKILNANIDL